MKPKIITAYIPNDFIKVYKGKIKGYDTIYTIISFDGECLIALTDEDLSILQHGIKAARDLNYETNS